MTEKERFIINYVSDGFYYYLMHLLHRRMCRRLVGISFFTVLTWLSRLYEVRRRFFHHVGADPQKGRWSVNQESNRNYTAEGTIEEGSAVVLKAKALDVLEEELARFEERLERLTQEIDRAKEEIRKLIRKTKLMIIIGFTALLAFQILLRWIRF